jgi:beta-lactamase superfamily II metal-dependent hydrolase
VSAISASAQQEGLDIYFVDTEGGAATLIITPTRESVLIDCGNPGDRDAARIYHVAHDVARLTAIDHLIITHWHSDHYGGAGPLAKLMPIKHCYDKGIPDKSIDDPDNFPKLIAAYKEVTQGKSTTIHVGDQIPLAQPKGLPSLSLKCLVANKQTEPDDPSPAKVNGYARLNKPQPEDPSDNANSLGFLLSYGYFRFLDLGDLTWNLEYKLIAPNDKIGMIDVYQSTHHGIDQSNNPVLVKTVRPIVAVINNGPHKGGTPQLFNTLLETGSLQAIYEQHRNLDAAPPSDLQGKKLFIANMDEACKAEFIEIQVVAGSATYRVSIGERGKPQQYVCRLTPVPELRDK